jgi:transposase
MNVSPPAPGPELPAELLPEPESELRGSVLEVLNALLGDFAERDTVLSLVGQLVARNAELEQRLARIASRFKKSEKVSKAQLVLFLDALQRGEGEPETEPAVSAEEDDADRDLRESSGIDEREPDEDLDRLKTRRPRRQPPSRTPAPAHLPRVDNPIEVPADQRPCPRCGAERVCIGHDITEVIELVPAQVIVRRDLREKLACESCEGEIARAPVGDKVVPSGKLGPRLVGHILVDKYSDGLPLHRQRERFRRLGLDLPISTLADQVGWCAELLRPLWRAALAEVIAARVMHLDATSLAVLDRKVPGGKRQGALWGYVGVNPSEAIAAYLYTTTGKKVGQQPGELGPEDMLDLRDGPTVADASNLFDESFRRTALIECGCNMHARRYFVKALDGGDKRAALPLAAYKRLYEIEAEICDRDDEAKLAERVARSKPVWDSLAKWCRVHKASEPPSSPLGVAIRYFTNHQVALGRFLEHGFVPLDNGIVERLHVRTALTRKNFLFAGSDAGGERAAIAYTILGCCRLADVDPIAYLQDVLPRLARRIRLLDLPALLPSRWKAARLAAAFAAHE